MPSNKVEIEIGARIDKLDRALEQAKQKVRATAEQISRVSSFGAEGQRASVTGFLGINARQQSFGPNIAQLEERRRQLVMQHNAAQSRKELESGLIDRIRGGDGSGPMGGGLQLQLGGGLAQLSKGVITVAALESGLKVATGLVQGIKGDFDAVEGTIRSLPLGIGGVIGSVIDFTRELAGAREEAEKLAEQTRKLNALKAGVRTFADEGKPLRQENERIAYLRDRGNDPLAIVERDRQEALAKIREEQAALEAEARRQNKANGPGGGRFLQFQLQDIGNKAYFRERDVNVGADEKRQAVLEERAASSRDAEHQISEGLRQESDAQIHATIEREQRIKALNSEAARERLLAQGNEYAAQVEAIEENYRQQVRGVSEGEKQKLAALRDAQLENAAIGEQKNKEQEREQKLREQFDMRERAGQEAKSKLERSADNLAGQRLEASDAGMLTRGVEDPSRDVAIDQTKLTEETNKILEEMRELARRRDAATKAVGFK